MRLRRVATRAGAAGPGLRDVSATIDPGGALVVAGPADSGAADLIALVLGTERPVAGAVELFGQDASGLSAAALRNVRRRIGFMPHDLRLLDELSAFDNAAVAPRIAGRRAADYRGELVQVLAWVGLGSRMGAPAGALGPVDRRRLALARAVMGRPDLIIADEPAWGLDQAEGLGLLKRLAELNRAGTAVLIVTDDEVMAASIGAPVLWLEGGRVRKGRDTLRAPAA